MSTVLWANTLIDGVVESDESDKYVLYKYTKKLDKLTSQLQVASFISSQDTADMQVNFSGVELPEGMESTTELMGEKGVWITGAEAVLMLEKLLSYITVSETKFGLFRNLSEEVVDELKESLESAKKAENRNGMFNFSVVV